MRIARYSYGGAVYYGVVEGGEILVLPSHPFGAAGAQLVTTGEVLDLDSVKLLAPVIPSKIVGIGKNYADHVAEMAGPGAAAGAASPPTEPLMFLKPTTSLIGPDEPIVLPPLSQEVHYEAELAVVIGRLCRNVPVGHAGSVILGYTCANDVTARDLQRRDGQWTRAKGFDTFCPLGPWIDTEIDPTDVVVECDLDGVTVQSACTATLIHPVAELVAAVSAVMTLLPGDVILTGTPAGVGPLHRGAEVAVTVAGLGTLVNPVT